MDYPTRLENVSVLGAAGKMGSGILLLTAMEMAELSLQPENKDRVFILNAIDISDRALQDLMGFLHTQVKRIAEKKTVALRTLYADSPSLVENYDIVEQYVKDVMRLVRPSTLLHPAYSSNLIFEAVVENPGMKIRLFKDIEAHTKGKPWYFTNTSSIPIHTLDREAELGGRLIGFHFYNPPAVQRLVELISAESTLSPLEQFAREYAGRLGKKIVPANDVAGFIGNGHFMRDALFGISAVSRLQKNYSFAESLYMVNRITQDFLIRPMGIFQLIDYVGLDVCQYIMTVMNPHMSQENLHSDLLDRVIGQGIRGGQHASGAQKDGFLQYKKGRPVSIWDPAQESYVSIEDFREHADGVLGSLPDSHQPWRKIVGDPAKDEVLSRYFQDLRGMDTLGARLAVEYGQASREIARKLVTDGVAESETDVNTVLLTGFYHCYGPINDYF